MVNCVNESGFIDRIYLPVKRFLVWFSASYPDVSVLIVPCASSPDTRVSLAFRARLCAKNEAPEEEAGLTIVWQGNKTMISMKRRLVFLLNIVYYFFSTNNTWKAPFTRISHVPVCWPVYEPSAIVAAETTCGERSLLCLNFVKTLPLKAWLKSKLCCFTVV